MKRTETDFAPVAKDMYFTPESAVVPLVAFLERENPNGTFYEPCAGDGRLVHHIHKLTTLDCVGMSDLDPATAREVAEESFGGVHQWDVEQRDAFDVTEEHLNGASMIITNPPWTRTKASGYLLHRLIVHFSDMRPTWFLFDADWAHTKQASPYMERLTDIVAVGRVKMYPDSSHSGKDNWAWYRFGKPTGAAPRFHGRV